MQRTEFEQQNMPMDAPAQFRPNGWAIAIAIIGLILGSLLVFLAVMWSEAWLALIALPDVKSALKIGLISILAAMWASAIQVVCAIGLLCRQKWAASGLIIHGFVTMALLAIWLIVAVGQVFGGNDFNPIAMPFILGYGIYLLGCSLHLQKLLRA